MRSARLVGFTAAIAVAGCGGGHGTKVHPATIVKAKALLPYASDQTAYVGHVASAPNAGTTLASLGFDPASDGFSFENYGFITGTDVDPHAMRRLFGDRVCANTPSDSCNLTPAAQQWVQQTDDAMAGGHCFGFSVTALRFFKHDLNPSQFGGTNPFSLGLTSSLQSEIAYGWAMQELDSVRRAASTPTPTGVVKFLEHALANHGGEVYTIGIHNRTGGHAITPIAIEDLGGGRFNIVVYDNNFPDTQRAISVDTSADTWSYQGGPNPSDTTELYKGQGSTNPMVLFPLSAGLGTQPCPFCAIGANGRGTTTVSLGGNPDQHGHLLITAAGGRRLGFVHGHFINEIKGAHVYRPFLIQDWKAHPEPIYELPSGGPLHVTLDGAGATGQDAATLHVSGPGFGATISNLRPAASFSDRITIAPGGRGLSLQAAASSPSQAPAIQLSTDHGRGGSVLSAMPSSLAAGGQLTLTLNSATNRLSIAGSRAAPVALMLTQVRSTGSHTASSGGVTVAPGRKTTFSFGLSRVS